MQGGQAKSAPILIQACIVMMTYFFTSKASNIILEVSEHRISSLDLDFFINIRLMLRNVLLAKGLLYFHDKISSLCFASLL